MIHTCLSIAGFDGSGGAGIQADLKTFSATGTYGMTVLTALPVQNTCGVKKCYEIPLPCIQEQLDSIFEDIKPHAIKIGMLYSTEIIELVSHFLKNFAQDIPIVLDPVMIAKSGDPLLKSDAINALIHHLIPQVTVLTPNNPEAKSLIPGVDEKNELAKRLLALGCGAVFLKGGHDLAQTCDDLFLSHDQEVVFSSPRIESKNTHGTGCTLSAAIASYLAQGLSPLQACRQAKSYLYEAIVHSKDHSVGKGNGPVHHFHHLWKCV